MAETIESQIRVYIRAIIQGLPEVKAFSATLREIKRTAGTPVKSGFGQVGNDAKKAGTQTLFMAGAMRTLSVAMSPIIGLGRAITGVFTLMVRQIQFAVAAFALFVASSPALAFGFLVKEGIQFNSIMEQTKIGLAALIQSTHDLFTTGGPNKPLEGAEAYSAALTIAEESANRLRVKIIPLAATSEELFPIFNQIVTAGAQVGFSLEQLEDTFISLAAAAQILQIPTARLGTEIRLLLSGTVRATSRLGPALFGSAAAARDFIRDHTKAGDLFQALQLKLVGYNAALIKSAQSYEVLKDNTVEVFQILAGYATSKLFDQIKAGLTKIVEGFYDLDARRIKPEFESLFNFINNALGIAGEKIVDLIGRAIGLLSQAATYVQDNQEYVSTILGDLINIFVTIGQVLGSLFGIVGEADQARKKFGDWHTVLGVVATIIGVIGDGLNIVIGIIQSVASAIFSGFLAPLEIVLDVLSAISTQAAAARDAISGFRSAANDFAKSGLNRIVDGASGTQTRAAALRSINNDFKFDFGAARSKTSGAGGFSSRLRKGAPISNAGGREAARIAREIAAASREFTNSQINLAQEAAQRGLDITRDLIKREIDLNEQKYEDFKIDLFDYYQIKSELETKDARAEIAHLKELLKIEADRFRLKKADVLTTKDAPEAKAKRVAALANDFAAKQLDIQTKIDIKENEIANNQANNDRTRIKAAQDLSDLFAEINDKISETARNGFSADAVKNRIDREFRDVLARGRAEGQDSFVRQLEEYIRVLKARANLDETVNTLNLEQNAQRIEATRLEDQLNQGKLTQVEYERQLNDLLAQQFERQRAILQAVIDSKDASIEQVQAAQVALADLERSQVRINSLAQSINGTLRDSLGGFFDDILAGQGDVLRSFQQMISGMLISMSKAIFQAVILSSIFKALGIGGGSTGGLGGFLSGLLGFGNPIKKAEGGIISGPGTGVSDSIPALLSNGEAVIPAAQVARHYNLIQSLIKGTFAPTIRPMRLASGAIVGNANSSAPAGSTRIINSLDPDLFEDYANSPAGEKTFLNFISRNPSKVKQYLGLS